MVLLLDEIKFLFAVEFCITAPISHSMVISTVPVNNPQNVRDHVILK